MSIDEIKKHIEPILKKSHISQAGIFGSNATKSNNSENDVDILIRLETKISLLEFVKVKLEIEDNLGKSVDLVEYNSIKPRLKDRILDEEIRLYG